MRNRYLGITLVILGALMMMGSFTIESDYERYVRILGGSLFFIGTLIIPDYFITTKNKTENK